MQSVIEPSKIMAGKQIEIVFRLGHEIIAQASEHIHLAAVSIEDQFLETILFPQALMRPDTDSDRVPGKRLIFLISFFPIYPNG
jgi:hypothetical protein